MALFFHSNASLVMAECACANLIFTSFIDVPSLVCVEPKYLNWFKHLSVHLVVGRWSWLDAVDKNFPLARADWEILPTVIKGVLM